jgi:hypothetical protein
MVAATACSRVCVAPPDGSSYRGKKFAVPWERQGVLHRLGDLGAAVPEFHSAPPRFVTACLTIKLIRDAHPNQILSLADSLVIQPYVVATGVVLVNYVARGTF